LKLLPENPRRILRRGKLEHGLRPPKFWGRDKKGLETVKRAVESHFEMATGDDGFLAVEQPEETSVPDA